VHKIKQPAKIAYPILQDNWFISLIFS